MQRSAFSDAMSTADTSSRKFARSRSRLSSRSTARNSRPASVTAPARPAGNNHHATSPRGNGVGRAVQPSGPVSVWAGPASPWRTWASHNHGAQSDRWRPVRRPGSASRAASLADRMTPSASATITGWGAEVQTSSSAPSTSIAASSLIQSPHVQNSRPPRARGLDDLQVPPGTWLHVVLRRYRGFGGGGAILSLTLATTESTRFTALSHMSRTRPLAVSTSSAALRRYALRLTRSRSPALRARCRTRSSTSMVTYLVNRNLMAETS